MAKGPIHFWKEKDNEYPLLASLAKLYLCVHASSFPSKRIFSTAGDLVIATRACLDVEHVDQLTLIKASIPNLHEHFTATGRH